MWLCSFRLKLKLVCHLAAWVISCVIQSLCAEPIYQGSAEVLKPGLCSSALDRQPRQSQNIFRVMQIASCAGYQKQWKQVAETKLQFRASLSRMSMQCWKS